MPMPIEIGWMLVAVAFTHVTINSTDIEPEIQYECVSFDINDILLNMKTNSIHSMNEKCRSFVASGCYGSSLNNGVVISLRKYT